MKSKYWIVSFSLFCILAWGEETLETQKILQFENEQVKVWKTIIPPNQALTMHRHDRARVVIGLKGGVLTKITEFGDVSDLVFETGKAYWLSEDPPGELHGDLNETGEVVEVMVIEMKN